MLLLAPERQTKKSHFTPVSVLTGANDGIQFASLRSEANRNWIFRDNSKVRRCWWVVLRTRWGISRQTVRVLFRISARVLENAKWHCGLWYGNVNGLRFPHDGIFVSGICLIRLIGQDISDEIRCMSICIISYENWVLYTSWNLTPVIVSFPASTTVWSLTINMRDFANVELAIEQSIVFINSLRFPHRFVHPS